MQKNKESEFLYCFFRVSDSPRLFHQSRSLFSHPVTESEKETLPCARIQQESWDDDTRLVRHAQKNIFHLR
jgi:hypothetical protein